MVLIALGTWSVLTFVVEPLPVESDSMEPTYRAGDELLVDKLAHGGSGGPHRRDVVIVSSPATGQLLVKRVAAVPGDSVASRTASWSSTASPCRSPT
jgi:signal peptidase I